MSGITRRKKISKGLSVSQQLLLLTVLPLFVITVLLTTYMVVTRQADRESMLSDRGSSMTRYLVGAAEFGLFAGDFVTLKRLANTMLEQDDVRAVRFFDGQENLLLAVSDEAVTVELPSLKYEYIVNREGLLWGFQAPVYYNSLDVDEFDVVADGEDEHSPVLGWVQLIMDEQRMRQEQQAILVTSLVMGVLGFLLLFLLAGFVARGISRPISSLTDTVRALEKGNLSERSTVDTSGELGELVGGVNNLAASVEEASRDLNARVDEATGRLTGALNALERRNEQLEVTREELLAASAAKGDFLARMSHELRTPLTAVSGYAKLLQTMSPTDSQEEYLKSITGASRILLSTIDDILDFTRLESGVVAIEELPFCLEDALEDVLAMHALSAHEKQLELVLFIEPDVPLFVIGDALRLRQVLTNLVSNALKFTDNGQVIITASLVLLEENEAELLFTVRDSGIGISPEHQSQLFDAFSQANKTIPRRFGGTGLGLAISKELTKLMGGDIRIYSQSGQGTEVSFDIRCGVADEALFVEANDQFENVSRDGKLFIYERNPWMRRFLRGLSLTVSNHVSDSDSLRKLLVPLQQSTSVHDVLVMGLGGNELRVIQRDELLTEIRQYFSGPIVLLAGMDLMGINSLEDECARFGPLYVRSKPIRRVKLQSVLRLATNYKENRRVETVFNLPDMPKSDRLKGARILVAEDNEFNRNLICTIVEAEGGDVSAARDGIEVLREINEKPVDLVLMDLNMPRLDGRQAVQEMRRSDPLIAQIPVIALTAEVFEDDDHGLLEQGFDRVLFKPLNEVLLIDTISELLAGKNASKVLASPPSNTQQPSFLRRLPVELLNEEVVRQLKQLDISRQQRDFKTVSDQAHQLRSVMYGIDNADEVVVLVRELELACDTADYEVVSGIYCELEEKLSALLAASL